MKNQAHVLLAAWLGTTIPVGLMIGCSDAASDEPEGTAAADSYAIIANGNLTANPSFESNTNNWGGWNSTITRVAQSGAPDGRYVVKVTRSGGSSYTIDDNPATIASTTAGQAYTGAAFVKAASSSAIGKQATITLRETTPSNVVVKTSAASATLSSSFVQISASHTAASSGNRLEVYVAQTGAVSGDAFYADAITLTTGSSTPPDGGAPPPTDAGTDSGGGSSAVSTFQRPFAAQAWLYAPLPSNVGLDPANAAMMASFTSGHGIALDAYAVPFYEVNSSTPTKAVNCLENWGTCQLEQYSPRPLTSSMIPSAGSDGAMVVIDVGPRTSNMRGRAVDNYWQYSWNGGSPTTSWGGVLDLDGDGRGTGGATGSGFSRAAGVVRAFEIEAGVIDHALIFSTNKCKTTTFRYPAISTDGRYSGADAIPEGARFQLDPSLDPNAYSLNKAERAIFVALQKYGAYAMDCGGATAAIVFEDIPGNPGTIYEQAGLAWDYWGLEKIPWSRGRFLKSWNGQ